MARILLFLPAVLLLGAWAVWSGLESDDVKSGPEHSRRPARPDSAAPDPGPISKSARLDVAFEDVTGFFRMGEPRPGDWLDRHDEPGQTFRQYVAERPVRASRECNFLSFQPAGEFRPEEADVAAVTYTFAGL